MSKSSANIFVKAGRRSRTRRGLAFAAVAGLTVGLAVLASPALGAVTTNFELDGNVLDGTATGPDWGGTGSNTNSIFTVGTGGIGVTNTGIGATGPLANFLSAGFKRDFTPGATSDSSTYTNGSKDGDNISTGWKCVSANNVTDKGDIQNGYAAAYNDPNNGDLILYFGMEKNAPNGDNNMGVWFLQDGRVGCDNPNGGAGLAFTGDHTDGDILLVAAFSNGGGTPSIKAYRWEGDANGSLNTTAVGTGGSCSDATFANLCAITNDTSAVTTPWQTTNKASVTPQNKTGQGTTLGADQFYEGAINLSAQTPRLDVDSAGDPICVNKFVFDTRSATSLTATLYDYAVGDVQTCASPTISTNLYLDNPSPTADTSLAPPAQTVTLPATVYDTSAIAGALGTPTGTVTYSLWTNNTCTTAASSPAFSPASSATVTINADGTVPNSPSLLFTTAGSYWWQAAYTGGGRNAAATSVCSTEPLIVQKPQPVINTTPSPTSLTIGGTPPATFSDTASITAGYFPSGGIAVGNVVFKLYGPFAPTATIGATSCTATNLLTTSTNAATRTGDTTASATSDAYTPTVVGVYQWTAAYAGNAQNLATGTTACGLAAEQVTVNPATPSVATKILLSDRAKVTGVNGAGAIAGSVRFQLFPNADCSGTTTSYDVSNVALVNGEATTPAATAVAAGTYSWKVTFTPDTSASGNANYVGASTTCTAAQSDEKAVISYAGTSPIS